MICSKCGKEFPDELKKKHKRFCPKCINEDVKLARRKDRQDLEKRQKFSLSHKKWSMKNKEKRKEYSRQYDKKNGWKLKLKKNYGLTLAEYDIMFARQNGLCAICGKSEVQTKNGAVIRLSVDHNHTTGKNRDLLCSKCNKAIGLFNEDIQIMNIAIEYLERHNGC